MRTSSAWNCQNSGSSRNLLTVFAPHFQRNNKPKNAAKLRPTVARATRRSSKAPDGSSPALRCRASVDLLLAPSRLRRRPYRETHWLALPTNVTAVVLRYQRRRTVFIERERCGSFTPERGTDPGWPRDDRVAKSDGTFGRRAKARLSRPPCVDPPNLRGPTTHPRGGARQVCSARSERGRLIGDNYRPASATRRPPRSFEEFQHSSSCGKRLHPIVPPVVSRNPHPRPSSQQA